MEKIQIRRDWNLNKKKVNIEDSRKFLHRQRIFVDPLFASTQPMSTETTCLTWSRKKERKKERKKDRTERKEGTKRVKEKRERQKERTAKKEGTGRKERFDEKKECGEQEEREVRQLDT